MHTTGTTTGPRLCTTWEDSHVTCWRHFGQGMSTQSIRIILETDLWSTLVDGSLLRLETLLEELDLRVQALLSGANGASRRPRHLHPPAVPA